MAFLAVSMLLTNIVAVSANPGLEYDQGDEITYELTEVTSGLSYNNMTGSLSGFENVMNMSEGDEMTFELAVVTENVLVHGIESYDPANNFSNTYDYNASDLFTAVTYAVPFPGTLWYETWFAYNPFYGIYYSGMLFVPWVLTDDFDDHEDSWDKLLAWEVENSSFAGVADITGDVEDKTFTMTATFNASQDTAMGTTDEFDGEIAYKVIVEFAGDGHVTKQDITMRDWWLELENSSYDSVHVVWEETEGLPLLYIAIPVVAVAVAVVVYFVLKK
jgi:hypothetical protein